MRSFLTARWLLPIAGLVIGLAGVIGLGLALRPHTFAGTLLQSPRPAADFTLASAEDPAVSLSDLRGQVVLLFFGYTACPDVCPTTLLALRDTLDALGGRADQVRVVMVSVDPEKDTPQRMRAYLNNIDGRILGLSGELETITAAATQYGVFFQKRVYNDSGGYLVDHTATVMLIDAQGYLRVVYPYGTPGKAIASDAKYILTH